MKNLFLRSASIAVLGLVLAVNAFAQEEGDYRSVAQGDWSAASTWEVYQSGDWTAAASAPTGSEMITITGDDTVSVDVAVSVTGHVQATESGVLEVGAGSLEIADGGVYEHARNEGSIPSATWSEGATIQITGVTEDAPDNSNQAYHHIVFNSPDLTSNEHMSLDEVTIGGNVTVENTGSARWYLTSASAEDTSTVTLMGDVIVQDGNFSVQGTGNALSTFIVHHHGNINVTGGNFSISRGSQGNGSGTTTWYLYGGNMSVANAETQNSNPTVGNAKFVFAGAGTQQLTFDTVDYAGGDIHFEISDSTSLEITQAFVSNGLLRNAGELTVDGELTFTDGGIYEHAQDAGTMPTATWEEGSTAIISGTVNDAPDDRGQDYYNLTLNAPGMLSNNDLSLDGNSVLGDLTVLSSGSARWRLVGGSSGEVTIMGDLIVQDASFETQGTGSETDVVVHHYGNVDVTNGNFSVSRGSQSDGAGTTTWYLYGGDFTMASGETQNSNPTPGNARFVFAGGDVQTLTLDEETEVSDLSIEVSDSTTLDVGTSEIGGSGIFWMQQGATLATAHPDGVAGSIQTSGDVTLSEETSFTFNGTEAQVTSEMMPLVVNDVVIDNEAGVELTQATVINGTLRLLAGEFDNTIPFTLGPEGSISREGGTLAVTTSREPTADIPTEFELYANYPNPFNPSTMIKYDIKERTDVAVAIYDVAGRLVTELVNANQVPGRYQVEWNATGQASGVYYYQIRAGDWTATKSLLLVK